MKINPFTIKEHTYPSGATVFRLNGMLNGKQVRKFFASLAEATTAKQGFENELHNLPAPRVAATKLTQAQIDDAERATAELAGKGSLVQAARYFLDNYTDPTKRGTVSEAFQRFIDAKTRENNRPQTIRNLKVRVGFLKKAHPDKLVSDIQTEQIKAIVFQEGRGPVTQDNDRRALLSFFNWCVREGYCPKNPMATIGSIKTDREEPEILPLDRVRSLLKAATEHKEGVCLPYVVLATFCAIRPTELARLSWEEIDLKARTVTIGAKLAKMRQRRIVEIPKNAVDWLKPHALEKKPLVGANWRRDFDAVKALAGYGSADEASPKLKPWTVDIMRHTGISYHLAQYKHEGKTATWAGNSPDIIQRHYKGLVTAGDAEAFWGITPKVKRGQILKLKAA